MISREFISCDFRVCDSKKAGKMVDKSLLLWKESQDIGQWNTGALLGELRLLQAVGLGLHPPASEPLHGCEWVPPRRRALLLCPSSGTKSRWPWAVGDGNSLDSGLNIIIIRSIGENLHVFFWLEGLRELGRSEEPFGLCRHHCAQRWAENSLSQHTASRTH